MNGGDDLDHGFDSSVAAVTLQRTPYAFGHGRVAAARSLGRVGVPVYSVFADRWSPTALSRYSRGGLIRRRPADDEEWLQNLLTLAERLGSRPVLIPIGDEDVFFLERWRETLAEAYRFPPQPSGLVAKTADKRAMNELCRELGVATPGAIFPAGEQEAIAAARALGFPAVLKQIDASLPGKQKGLRVLIARDEGQLREGYRLMESDERPNVMVQEYIPGGSDSVWMMNAYFGEGSRCHLPFTGRKLRQYPPNSGATTLGICTRNEAVQRATRELAEAVGYRGIIDIGWRYDARDGEYKLLDLNPRLGATFRLFVGARGMDVLRALHLDMTGRPVPADDLQEGRRWITELQDLRTSARLIRSRELTLRSWVQSLSGVAEASWMAFDDPVPAAALATRIAGTASKRAVASNGAAKIRR
jgi:predicted ATP-grasp superfamily ATP-dependent carboligase